jgi:hypothetical protein
MAYVSKKSYLPTSSVTTRSPSRMPVADHFAVPAEPTDDIPGGVTKDMAHAMDPYLVIAQELERQAELLMVLPEHDDEGQLVRRELLAQAAAFRRAAKYAARDTWTEADRGLQPPE